MMLLKMVISSVALVMSPWVFACDNEAMVPLDKVMFQLSAKQWVSTDTARLSVMVNATLTEPDLAKARADILNKLTSIASGDWHITQFDRSQDSSGLAKLLVEAEVRLPQAGLNAVYQNAKKVSKPGMTYTISSIEFKPGIEDTQQAKSQVREQLYKMVNDELTHLNQVYTKQNYTINRLYFFDGDAPMPGAVYKPRQMDALVMAQAPLTVSNEITMTAVVELASARKTGDSVAHS